MEMEVIEHSSNTTLYSVVVSIITFKQSRFHTRNPLYQDIYIPKLKHNGTQIPKKSSSARPGIEPALDTEEENQNGTF